MEQVSQASKAKQWTIPLNNDFLFYTRFFIFVPIVQEFESLSQIRILQTVCLGYRFTSDPHFVDWFQHLRLISEDER